MISFPFHQRTEFHNASLATKGEAFPNAETTLSTAMELVTGVFGDERLPGKVGVRPASIVSSSLGGLGAKSFAIRWALPAGYSYVVPVGVL